MEEIAEIVEKLINLNAALALLIPDRMHVEAMRSELPEVRDRLKEAYLKLGGEDYWRE